MKLEKWALIAEIIGGVAIVLSLLFVGLEIRGNTQVARAEAYESNIDSINEWRLELIRDPRLVATAGEFYEVFGDDATDERHKQTTDTCTNRASIDDCRRIRQRNAT